VSKERAKNTEESKDGQTDEKVERKRHRKKEKGLKFTSLTRIGNIYKSINNLGSFQKRLQ
jgi:hypothetical protein